MRLATLAGGGPGVLLAGGEVLDLVRAAAADDAGGLEAWIPADMASLLRAGPAGLAVVRGLRDRVADASPQLKERLRAQGFLLPAGTRLAAPVQPRLIVAAGLAYRSHLAEMAGTPAPAQPTGFLKSPHSVTGPDAVVTLPPSAAEHVDYEGELAVVFGRHCHCVDEAEALAHVAGYTVANDLSARDWVREVWAATQPWQARQTWEVNIMGKQFPGFTPLGPALLTADAVPDPAALQLTTRLNGRVMQDAPVSDLIFPLSRTIAWFSRWYRFAPGDVLLTGTPAGVGVGRQPPVFLRPGDRIEVEVTGIGVLRNTLQAAGV